MFISIVPPRVVPPGIVPAGIGINSTGIFPVAVTSVSVKLTQNWQLRQDRSRGNGVRHL